MNIVQIYRILHDIESVVYDSIMMTAAKNRDFDTLNLCSLSTFESKQLILEYQHFISAIRQIEKLVRTNVENLSATEIKRVRNNLQELQKCMQIWINNPDYNCMHRSAWSNINLRLDALQTELKVPDYFNYIYTLSNDVADVQSCENSLQVIQKFCKSNVDANSLTHLVDTDQNVSSQISEGVLKLYFDESLISNYRLAVLNMLKHADTLSINAKRLIDILNYNIQQDNFNTETITSIVQLLKFLTLIYGLNHSKYDIIELFRKTDFKL